MGSVREGEDVGSTGAVGRSKTVVRSGSRGSIRSEISSQGTIREGSYRRKGMLDEREEGGEVDKRKVDKGKGKEILDASTIVHRGRLANGTPSSGGKDHIKEPLPYRQTRSVQNSLRKGLLDSYISISIPDNQPGASSSSKQRTDSSNLRVGASSRGKLSRSESFSSVSSRRKRVTSTSANQPPLMEWTTPVFISSTNTQSIHPTFEIEQGDFLVRFPVDDWVGFRESHLLVGVWVKPGGAEGGDSSAWELLIEWDVEMNALISIGRDVSKICSLRFMLLSDSKFSPTQPLHFRALPPNSLILKMNSEYYTCPLPSKNRHSSDSCSSDSEIDGNQSDPGVVSAAMIQRRDKRDKSEKEKERRKKRDLVERSRRETRMVQGAGWEEVAWYGQYVPSQSMS